MKKILIGLFVLFTGAAVAETITVNWYNGDSVYDTTTCTVGDDLILPSAPTKYGYTFQGWRSYIPIEYIESTGTQYIDTGFKPNQDTRVVMEYMVTTRGTQGFIFGARNAALSSKFAVLYSGENRIRSDYGSNEANGPSLNNGFYLNKLKVDKNKNETVIYNISDESVLASMTNPSQAFQTNYTFLICALHNGAAVSLFSGGMRVYSVQLYDYGTLIRDMVPVLGRNNTACMYDKISKTCFYSAGTDEFIAGPIISE